MVADTAIIAIIAITMVIMEIIAIIIPADQFTIPAAPAIIRGDTG